MAYERGMQGLPGTLKSTPEFTARAVLLGLLIGCLLCFTNLYFGLQTGWISMMSLQSTLIGYLVSLSFTKPLSPQENVILQTTAVATGTMPLAAGFVGIIPALGLLNPSSDGIPALQLSWIQGVAWSLGVAFFGVFLAAPLRKQVIIKEKLAFPSGTATAQLITVLHRISPVETNVNAHRRNGYQAIPEDEGSYADSPRAATTTSYSIVNQEANQADLDESWVSEHGTSSGPADWFPLVWSFALSGLMTLTAYFFPVIFAIPLFGTYLARQWAWFFTPSLSYVGQGIIMGFPTTMSMNAGMILGWAILSPLSKLNGWAPGPVGDMTTGARGWILWTALAIMCADSLVSLLPIILEYGQKQLSRNGKRSDDTGLSEDDHDQEIETAERLVPLKWVGWGIGASVVSGTFLVWLVFGNEGIKPWATFVGYAIGALLSVLGVRALGETDLNPVSGLGKVSQLLFAVLQPGNVVANIVAGGVAEAGAQQAGDLMQDLKTGHLVRASPRAQFFGQLIGSTLSIFVTTTAYNLYTRAYSIPGPEFPAPTAYVWLSLARLLRDGSLPPRSKEFMLTFGLLFGLLSGFRSFGAKRQDWSWWARWLPSGVAFAIGFLNTPSFSLARLIGGVVEFIYHRRMEKAAGSRSGGRRDIRLIIIASGFVLGEGVISVVSLVLKTFGVGPASCLGCGTGICAGCP